MENLWRLLKEWYRDLQCHVRVGNVMSEVFKVLGGVFKGRKWSSRLFRVFYTELIRMMCEAMKGCNMYGLRVVCPMYTDDITIIAPYSMTEKPLENCGGIRIQMEAAFQSPCNAHT